MKTISQVASDLYKFFTESDNKKTKAYDTKAEVLRIDGDTVWVKIPGGIDETPVSRTNNANVGDQVMVRVSGGRAWILGNETSPATDDTQAFLATDMAMGADVAAKNAINSANSAQESANRAELEATRAKTSADEASGAALIATASANSALVQLSVIEDVSGTLDWIKKHGSYVLTTDTTVQEGTIYFIYNSQTQDYEPIVSPDPTKNPSTEGWFVLDITDSQTEFIMNHLAVTARGLWILPAGMGSAVDPQYAPNYKALLSNDALYIYNASGVQLSKFGIDSIIGSPDSVHATVKNDGLHIWNGSEATASNELANFLNTGSRIGADNSTSIALTKNAFSMTDLSGTEYVKFENLSDESGRYTIRKRGVKVESQRLSFTLAPYTQSDIDVNSIVVTNGNKTFTIDTLGYSASVTAPMYSSTDKLYHSRLYINLYKYGDYYILSDGDVLNVTYTINGVETTTQIVGPLTQDTIFIYDASASTKASVPTLQFVSFTLNGETAPYENDCYLIVRFETTFRTGKTSTFAGTGDECIFAFDATEEAKSFTLGSRKENSDIGMFSYCFGKNLAVSNPYEVAFGIYNYRSSDAIFSVNYGDENYHRTNFQINKDGRLHVSFDATYYDLLYLAKLYPDKTNWSTNGAYCSICFQDLVEDVASHGLLFKTGIYLNNISINQSAGGGWYCADISSILASELGSDVAKYGIVNIVFDDYISCTAAHFVSQQEKWYIISPVSITFTGYIGVIHVAEELPEGN